jgi:hypothetical protein
VAIPRPRYPGVCGWAPLCRGRRGADNGRRDRGKVGGVPIVPVSLARVRPHTPRHYSRLLCLPIESFEKTLMSSSAGHFGCCGSAFLERPLAGSSIPVVVHADHCIVVICHDPCNGNFVPACQTHRIFLRTVYVDMCAGPNIRRQPSVIILTTPWLRAAIPYATSPAPLTSTSVLVLATCVLPFKPHLSASLRYSSESVQSLEHFCCRVPSDFVPICRALPLCEIGA